MKNDHRCCFWLLKPYSYRDRQQERWTRRVAREPSFLHRVLCVFWMCVSVCVCVRVFKSFKSRAGGVQFARLALACLELSSWGAHRLLKLQADWLTNRSRHVWFCGLRETETDRQEEDDLLEFKRKGNEWISWLDCCEAVGLLVELLYIKRDSCIGGTCFFAIFICNFHKHQIQGTRATTEDDFSITTVSCVEDFEWSKNCKTSASKIIILWWNN